MWEKLRSGWVLDAPHVRNHVCWHLCGMCGGGTRHYTTLFPSPRTLPLLLSFPTGCCILTVTMWVTETPLSFFFFLKERQSFCFPILVIVKIHCYFLFYFSGIVLTLFARGYVMHGMIIWLFKRSGIHITGENIAGPTYIIAHTKDL